MAVARMKAKDEKWFVSPLFAGDHETGMEHRKVVLMGDALEITWEIAEAADIAAQIIGVLAERAMEKQKGQ